jgi:hypothetical protein
MPVVRTSLPIVLSRFPDHEDKIKRLFRKNETFRSLCEDYRQCSEALHYWSRCSSEEALARRNEYGNLLQDLSEEIWQNLQESK